TEIILITNHLHLRWGILVQFGGTVDIGDVLPLVAAFGRDHVADGDSILPRPVPAPVAAHALILAVGIQLCAPTTVEHDCVGATSLLGDLAHGGPAHTEFVAGVAAYADDVEVVLIVVSVNGSCRIECLELAPVGGVVECAY